jgi:hypothetical protein
MRDTTYYISSVLYESYHSRNRGKCAPAGKQGGIGVQFERPKEDVYSMDKSDCSITCAIEGVEKQREKVQTPPSEGAVRDKHFVFINCMMLVGMW